MCRPRPILPRRIDFSNAAQLHELVRLRRVRDRIDREYTQPLDVQALAHGADMTTGQLSSGFARAFGRSPYAYVVARRAQADASTARATEPVRNREASTGPANLALRS